ncbi:MAG: four helix bundle suffix domain-containing protein [Alistipes sp.]|nr:four helix bundle suffix domain-containing protein [Alistipes sp.]
MISTRSAETIANLAIVLIYQTDSMLYNFMLRVLERFAHEGGFREQLTRIRLQNRK